MNDAIHEKNRLMQAAKHHRSRHTMVLIVLSAIVGCVALIYARDIPSGLTAGKRGNAAIKILDEVRRPFLDIYGARAVLLNEGYSETVRAQLENGIDQGQRLVADFKAAAAYNPAVSRCVGKLANAFDAWMERERAEFDHAAGIRGADFGARRDVVGQGLLAVAAGGFSNTMALLGDVEIPIHEDIDRGTRAVKELIGLTGVLATGVLFMVFFHQWSKNRLLKALLTERELAGVALQEAHDELEMRVEQRSKELAKANEALQADISARKRIHEHLRIQAAALESAANGILITDREGRITWSNPAFSRMCGYGRAELIGKNPSILKSGEQPGEVYEQLWSTILAGESWSGELINRRKDGSLYSEEQTVTPVRDERGEITHFVAVKQNVTERKQAKAALQESERFNRRLVECSNDCTKVLDLEGRLLFISQTGQRLLEIDDVTPLLNKPWPDFFDGAGKEAALEAVASARSGAVGNFQGYCPTRSGEPKWWDIVLTAIPDSHGQVEKILAISRDITERKRAEADLHSAKARLEYLLASSSAVIYSCQPSGEYPATFISENIRSQLGYDAEEWLSDSGCWANAIHPDDRSRDARVWIGEGTQAAQAGDASALWGVGAPFADFPEFLVAMERGGVAAMEMLCRDLKSVGTYLSRTISYGPTRREDGSVVPESAVEYEPLLHNLTENERRQYDQIADLWSELLTAFESAEQNAGQGRNSHRYAQFYSAQQRFFLQLMMAYTLPDVIPAIEKDLGQGRSVILSLFNTGEAQADRKVRDARAQGIELSELDATPREMIVQLIEKQFPIFQYREETDPVTGNVISVRGEDAAGNPEINRENQRQQEKLLDKVADLDFPQNSMDALITHFGVGNVAEISGRTHRFENGKYVRRKIRGVSRRQLNEYETRLFQEGRRRLAVISGAGSTGISVHADMDAKNQQRRAFYAFQLSWSADQQMQAFGRVHRSNQTSAPVIRLVLLDLAGQKRLVNAVSKRLAALGALTKGERHSLSSELFRPEDVTDPFGKAALARLYRQIETGRHTDEGLGLRDLDRMGVLNKEKTAVRDSYASNVEQFLNRIMVLHVEKQNRIFDLFYERYVEAVEAAKRQGAFDFGMEEIRARNLRRLAEAETLFVDPASGARTMLHESEGEVDVVRHAFAAAAGTGDHGFYRNKRSRRIYAVSKHWDAHRSEVFLTAVKGPRRALDHRELEEKYERVEQAEAREWWEAEYANTPATEPRRFHILSGAIFPIYDKVMGSSGIQTVKIARAVLADGQALVGLDLSASDVPNVKQRLGIGTPLGEVPSDEILGLLSGGALVELDNGWRLTAARITGDEVVELVLNGVPANRDELERYGFSEEIINYKRRWFILSDEAATVLPNLFAQRKPIRDLTAAEVPALVEQN